MVAIVEGWLIDTTMYQALAIKPPLLKGMMACRLGVQATSRIVDFASMRQTAMKETRAQIPLCQLSLGDDALPLELAWFECLEVAPWQNFGDARDRRRQIVVDVLTHTYRAASSSVAYRVSTQRGSQCANFSRS
jgi:hypothetical protein